MHSKDKEKIIKRYNERLKKFGVNIKTLASGTEERRKIRYQILTEIGDLNGRKVLDLGCGFGDFFGYLKNRGIECDYTGYDINPNLIKIARERFPEAKFEVKDILEDPFPEFDYILSSSAFNLKLEMEDNCVFIGKILKVCYEHAREGVAIDFLTSYVDYQKDYAFYYQPEKIFSIAKKITRRVCLRHDYPLFEFCIYLYKDIPFPY